MAPVVEVTTSEAKNIMVTEAKEAKIKADREAIKDKIYHLEVKVEKQSVQIRNLAKTAIHLEEEIQKKHNISWIK